MPRFWSAIEGTVVKQWHFKMFCLFGSQSWRLCKCSAHIRPFQWYSWLCDRDNITHSNAVIMGAMVSQIAGLLIVYWTVCSGADQIKHQNSALLAFVSGIHRWPVNSPHKGPVTRKMYSFHHVIMTQAPCNTIMYTYQLAEWSRHSYIDCTTIDLVFVLTYIVIYLEW